MSYSCPNCKAPLTKVNDQFCCGQCRGWFDEALLTTATIGAPRLLPGAHQVFVRRNEQIGALWQAWEATTTRRQPHVVFLRGVPGIGKTAILEHFYRQIASSKIWDPEDYWPDVAVGRLDQISAPDRLEEWKERADRTPRFMWFAARCNNVRSDLRGLGESDHDVVATSELDPWKVLLESTQVHRERWRAWMPVLGDVLKQAVEEGVGTIVPFVGMALVIGKAVVDRVQGRDRKLEKAVQDLDALVLRTFSRIADVDAGGLPLILAFDDLQWADGPSLDQLLALLERVRGRPVLILATVRSTDVRAESRPLLALMEQLERRKGDDLGYRVIDVGPLETTAVVEQLRLFLGSNRDDAAVEWLASKAEGMPLFADELARLAINKSILDTEGRFVGKHSLASLDAAWESNELPHDVKGVIGERIRRLRESDEQQHALLGFGAVEGRKFRDRVLDAVRVSLSDFKDLDLDGIRRRMQTAERIHDVIYSEQSRTSARGVEFSYVYTHSLLHDAFLRSLRTDEHVRCLEVLLQIHEQDRDAVEQLGVLDRIRSIAAHDLVWRQLAALRPLRVDEWPRAYGVARTLATLKRGVESTESCLQAAAHALAISRSWLSTAPDDPVGRTNVVESLSLEAAVLSQMGRFPEARRDSDQACVHARNLASTDDLVALKILWETLLQAFCLVDDLGLSTESRALAEEAVATASRIQRADLVDAPDAWRWEYPRQLFSADLALAQGETASALMFMHQSAATLRKGMVGIDSAEQAEELLLGCVVVADDFADVGQWAAARALMNEAVSVARSAFDRSNDPAFARLLCDALANQAKLAQRSGDTSAARAAQTERLDVAHTLVASDDDWTANRPVLRSLRDLAGLLEDLGDPTGSDELLRELLSIARRLDREQPEFAAKDELDGALAVVAGFFARRGDLAEARRLREERVRHARRCSAELDSYYFRWNVSDALSELASVLKDMGAAWEARQLLSESVAAARLLAAQSATSLDSLTLCWRLVQFGALLHEQGDIAVARAHYKEMAELATRNAESFTDAEGRPSLGSGEKLDMFNAFRWSYGEFLMEIGDREEAIAEFEERHRVSLRYANGSAELSVQRNLATSLLALADQLHRLGDLDGARNRLVEARDILERQSHQLDVESSNSLDHCLSSLADVFAERGERDAARACLDEGLQRARTRVERRGGADALEWLGLALFKMGRHFVAEGDSEAARVMFEERRDRARTRWRSVGDPAAAAELAGSLYHLWGFLQDTDEAGPCLEELIAHIHDTAKTFSGRESVQSLAASLRGVASSLRAVERADEAIPFFVQSVEVCRGGRDAFGDVQSRRDLHQVLSELASTHHDLGHHDDAFTIHQEALDVCRELATEVGDPTSLRDLALCLAWRADALEQRASIEEADGAFAGALEAARVGARKLGDVESRRTLSLALRGRARFLLRRGQFETAKELLDEQLAHAKRWNRDINSTDARGALYTAIDDLRDMGVLLTDACDYGKAGELFRSVVPMHGDNPDLGPDTVLWASILCRDIADLHDLQGDSTAALSWRRQSERHATDRGDERGIAVAHARHSETLRRLGQLEPAVELAQKAISSLRANVVEPSDPRMVNTLASETALYLVEQESSSPTPMALSRADLLSLWDGLPPSIRVGAYERDFRRRLSSSEPSNQSADGRDARATDTLKGE